MLHPIALSLQIAMLFLTAWAAYFDLQTRRIPNWLSLAGCVTGVAMNTAIAGIGGLKTAAFGLGLGFALYFPLWLLGARGAGDVKILAAVGSFAGPANTLGLFLIAAILGGILALGLVLLKGSTKQTFWNIAGILRSLLIFKRPDYRLSSPGALRLPHAVVIFLATVTEIFIQREIRNG